jgi:hypothetical protein
MDSERHRASCTASEAASDGEAPPSECRSGAERIREVSRLTSGSEQAGPPQPETYQMHERKFSIVERFWKLLTSPSEAMEDVAFNPDYLGPLVIVGLEVILLVVYVAVVLQRISFTGAVPEDVSTMWGAVVSIVVGLVLVLGSILYLVFWLVKSFLVRALTDSQSDWTFGTAASVTGYAYLADLVGLLINFVVAVVFIPSLSISLTLTRNEMAAQLESQIGWIRWVSIPFSVITLVWKSYLGGLGTHYGTEGKCSVSKGFLVFLVLALIGWAIFFLIRGF